MIASLAVMAMSVPGHSGYLSGLPGEISNTGRRHVRTGHERQHQKIKGQNDGCCRFQLNWLLCKSNFFKREHQVCR